MLKLTNNGLVSNYLDILNFQNSRENCPKNIVSKRFLFFKWKGEGWHDLEVTSLKRWGAYSWAKYEISFHCKICGAHFHEFGIPEFDLIRAGFELEN